MTQNDKTFLKIAGGFALVAALALVVGLPIYFTQNDDANDGGIVADAMADIKTECGYVEVRPNAHLFWLLYQYDPSFAPSFLTRLDPVPVVVWLQGGPGSASSGYGNFEEVGPLDLELKRRNSSWVGLAHLLFIDQPVGTGYSYVSEGGEYAPDVDQAGVDLINLLRGFYEKKPELLDNPLYIFSQSYGGKMAAAVGREIAEAKRNGQFPANFRGIGLGDAMISPMDYQNTWGQYLYQLSLLDRRGLEEVEAAAANVQQAVDDGDWVKASQLHIVAEEVIWNYTDNVDLYNVLYPHNPPETEDPTPALMNGNFNKYLGIIPDGVVWGSQRSMVFSAMEADFMKPIVDIVETNIKDGTKIVAFNGMLDLIIDTIGQQQWIERLTWDKIDEFQNKKWTPRYYKEGADTGGFSKTVDNFNFWWVLKAGHMVPIDQPNFMLYLLQDFLSE